MTSLNLSHLQVLFYNQQFSSSHFSALNLVKIGRKLPQLLSQAKQLVALMTAALLENSSSSIGVTASTASCVQLQDLPGLR